MHSAAKPRKQPLQARARVTVDAILEAAAHILRSQGYDAFNTNRVAEHAGVSIGSLYQYFPNKGSLLQALRERHAQAMFEQLMAQVPSAHSSIEVLIDQMVSGLLRAHQVDPILHRILEQEVPRQTQQAPASDWETQLRQGLEATLIEHADQLRVTDFRAAALVLTRSVDALIHACLQTDPMGVTPDRIEQETKALVRAYLLAAPTRT